ncbi:hypothetical protein K2173_009628 [Erythroxylum novogranatense]|uniref:Uncharacterized protein n=1 Tax=Erythroxylum novogranatense TaxID=1862640 RepID=A0AAV8U4F9_9ROSI|nr:hypothetical protein K2173_009628 [Erythroxylum novogranatense]
MVLDSVLSSPHWTSLSFRRTFSRDELGGWSQLVQRHHFLLTALALLTFLCTIYLYFAVTLGATDSCTGLTGKEKVLCHIELAKVSTVNGKLKFFEAMDQLFYSIFMGGLFEYLIYFMIVLHNVPCLKHSLIT